MTSSAASASPSLSASMTAEITRSGVPMVPAASTGARMPNLGSGTFLSCPARGPSPPPPLMCLLVDASNVTSYGSTGSLKRHARGKVNTVVEAPMASDAGNSTMIWSPDTRRTVPLTRPAHTCSIAGSQWACMMVMTSFGSATHTSVPGRNSLAGRLTSGGRCGDPSSAPRPSLPPPMRKPPMSNPVSTACCSTERPMLAPSPDGAFFRVGDPPVGRTDLRASLVNIPSSLSSSPSSPSPPFSSSSPASSTSPSLQASMPWGCGPVGPSSSSAASKSRPMRLFAIDLAQFGVLPSVTARTHA
mmetsp:Transcript_39171/g.121063  ORF Transcript_39171/g.121063 Transcript_39171/m.121063 type:complete len:302 (+) Transcript_39171:13-918(+)